MADSSGGEEVKEPEAIIGLVLLAAALCVTMFALGYSGGKETVRIDAVHVGAAQWTYKTNDAGVLVVDRFRWLPRNEGK